MLRRTLGFLKLPYGERELLVECGGKAGMFPTVAAMISGTSERNSIRC
jgi:hypothetical protein